MSRDCTPAHFGTAGADATNRRAVGGVLVTPIPSGLARPLVESLHCDAVMHNHDIDTIIPPPAGGLTPYRARAELALRRTSAEVNATGADVAAGLLPNDPGGRVRWFTDTRPAASRLIPNGFGVRSRAGARGTRRGWTFWNPGRVLKVRSDSRGLGSCGSRRL